MMAFQEALIQALKKQGRYFIVAPTYRQAKDIYWKQYLSMIPPELVADGGINNNELTIKLKHIQDPELGIYHDPNLPPSTIELKGMDSADNLRGMRCNGIIFDEFAFADDGLTKWELIFEPMLGVSQGWAMWISTPNGYNHFYELWMYAQGYKRTEEGTFELEDGMENGRPSWFYSHATPYDNPYFSDEEIDRIKQQRTEDNFEQEYMAQFRKMEGMVYREFSRETHMVKPSEVPKEGTNLVGIDFGFTNPFAAVFVRIDYDGNWWVFDEIYKRQLTTDIQIQAIKDKTGMIPVTAYVGDAQAAESIANFNKNRVPVIPANKGKDTIKLGIELISEKLKLREQMSGKPKPKLFVASNCINFISEIEQYVYPKGTDTRNPKEEPVKKNDHLMDAVRYLALTYQEGLRENYNFPDADLPSYV